MDQREKRDVRFGMFPVNRMIQAAKQGYDSLTLCCALMEFARRDGWKRGPKSKVKVRRMERDVQRSHTGGTTMNAETRLQSYKEWQNRFTAGGEAITKGDPQTGDREEVLAGKGG